MKTYKVYHDGKTCRDSDATLIKDKGRRKIFRYMHWDGEVKEEWFVKRRRNNNGVYESTESNYWFYSDKI